MDEHIEALRKAYAERNLNLYLGAGVSVASKLPTWEKLVLAMYYATISEQHMGGMRPFSNYLYAIAEWQLRNSTEPLEITARKLRKFFSDDGEEQDFLDGLHASLYDAMLDPTGQPLDMIDAPFLRRHNSTLDGVTALCEHAQQGIRSVVTYNYDSLLETALSQRPHQAVFENMPLAEDKLPIFHVHGYVPLDRNMPGSKGRDIVFTEDQYHRVAGDPYYWSNLVQLQAMSGSVGLMVGLSLSDRNMRRLLDAVQSAPIRARQYALLPRPKTDPPSDEVLDAIHEKAKEMLHKFADSGIKSSRMGMDQVMFQNPGVKSEGFVFRGVKGATRYQTEISALIRGVREIDQQQQEFVLDELGITPIWLDNFGQIPEILGAITA